MKTWIITDTHWFHVNIIKYEFRPKNFNELIIENWKSMVGKDDVVIHLGDVIFKKAGRLKDILSELPGYKILVKGNHDLRHKNSWFRNKGFDHVFMNWFYYKEEQIIFSHAPTDLRQFPKHLVRKNIHGHFHRMGRTDEGRKKDSYSFYSDNHIFLSLEESDYKPVELKLLLT